MQQQFTDMHHRPAIRHFMDSNAIVLWMSGIGLLAMALTLPAFV